MEKIVENVRIHNIHALLVIGGFEVRGQLPGSKRGWRRPQGVGRRGGPSGSPMCRLP